MTQPDTFADLLRRSRGDRSIGAVARESGVQRPNLSCMERGTRYPGPASLRRLCDYYGISFDLAAAMIAREKVRAADATEMVAD